MRQGQRCGRGSTRRMEGCSFWIYGRVEVGVSSSPGALSDIYASVFGDILYRTLENKLRNHSSDPSPSLSSISLALFSVASFLTDVSSWAEILSKLFLSHFKLSISPKG